LLWNISQDALFYIVSIVNLPFLNFNPPSKNIQIVGMFQLALTKKMQAKISHFGAGFFC